MPFLPRGFAVPERVETAAFRLRSITIHDAFKDFDAVMSSRAELWARFGAIWGWPAEDMTLEQNIVDLGWHQKEFQLRSSFDFAVMSLDESRLLGCVYVDPADADDAELAALATAHGGTHTAEVWTWVRSSELAHGLQAELDTFVHDWLARAWPFAAVRCNGELRALPVPPGTR